MNIDLHCHTNLSDGTLTPDQLLDLAVERDIKMLSITDHDTLDAYSEITSFPPSIEIITGIVDEAAEGHKYLEAGKSKGKVLYKI